jgi:hypothetical protein
MRFKEALSKMTLEEYGNLGKLINQGTIEGPLEPDRGWVDLTKDFDKVEYLRDIRTYQKLKKELELKDPYCMPKYMSDESLVENWSEIEEEVDPEHLWKHQVHSTSKVAIVVILEVRKQALSLMQSSFESIISYKQCYNNTLRLTMTKAI